MKTGEKMNKESLEALIKRIGEMGNKSISSFMVPISNVTFLDVNDSREILREKLKKSKRTFYPVCDGSPDHIIGIIHIKEILLRALSDATIDLREGLHEPVYFNEANSIHQVYDIFFQSNTGAAFVVNKKNNITGFITLKDVTKMLLGSIYGDTDFYESFCSLP